MSLDCCAHLGAKLADNVTCGEGCDQFPACLPTLELIRKLTERRIAADHLDRPPHPVSSRYPPRA
jgi:hypothetical protein